MKMKISNDCNIELAQTLQVQIGQIIEATANANSELTQKEIIFSLLASLGDVLINIDCPDCRRINKKIIERLLPTFLRAAMMEAAQSPHHQSSEHVH
jgi:hypothetical protein